MSLHVRPRADRPNTFQIVGNAGGVSIRQTAQSRSLKLAKEEAALLEAKLIREEHVGKGRRDRPFAEIAEAYLDFEPRSFETETRVKAVVRALGNVKVSEVDQDALSRIRKALIKTPNPMPNTVIGITITPVRSVLNFGAENGWCDRPNFKVPRVKKPTGIKDTNFFYPEEAFKILDAAPDHFKPIVVTLFGLGGRISETLAMEFEFQDLIGGSGRLIQKGGRERIIDQMPPAVIAAMSSVPYEHVGRVFKYPAGKAGRRGSGEPADGRRAHRRKESSAWLDYTVDDGDRLRRGHPVQNTWARTLKRAGVPFRSIHATRHTFATWHYAIHRDVFMLMRDGGWESQELVKRYTKLLPRGYEAEILRFWGFTDAYNIGTPHSTKTAPSPYAGKKVIA